jgi:signal peptidase II
VCGRPALGLAPGAVILIDQLTKQWALNTLEPGVYHEILGKWLGLQLVFNDGAALSIGWGHTWVLTVLSLVITVGIIVYAKRAQTSLAVWLFGLGLGGAIGNLIDRLFRAPSFGEGHVVDMINYNNFFVGNVADIAIVGAAAAVAVLAATGVKILEPKPTPADAEPSTNAEVDSA